MAKIGRNSSTRNFTLGSTADGKSITIRNKITGAVLTLKGYGALKGKYVVRKGINLSKPIAAQAAKTRSGSTALLSTKGSRKKAG